MSDDFDGLNDLGDDEPMVEVQAAYVVLTAFGFL
jgi:hypothetical protein